MSIPTDSQFRAGAKDLYHKDGEIEIDENAKVSKGEGEIEGAYVQAWVWVRNCDCDDTKLGEDEP